jgi:hypothetical protein
MFCDQCGAGVPRGARFCRVCGHELADPGPPSRAGRTPSNHKKRTWPFILVLVLLVLGSLLAVGAWRYREAAASTYERGYENYLQLDCERALRDVKRITGTYRYARSDLAEGARPLIRECELVASAERFQRRNDFEHAIDRYELALARFPSSAVTATVAHRLGEGYLNLGRQDRSKADTAAQLAIALGRFDHALSELNLGTSLRRRTEREVKRTWHMALAGRDQCDRAGNLVALSQDHFESSSARRVAREARLLAPRSLLRCARAAYRNRRYQEAIRNLRRLLRNYPEARSAAAGRVLLIDARVAAIKRGGTGRLPSPSPSGTSGTSSATLVVANDSDEVLELLLSGPGSQRLVIPACGNCRSYVTTPSSCATNVPSRTTRILPGRYDVVAQAIGGRVRPFSGSWAIQSGYRYRHCFFIVVS